MSNVFFATDLLFSLLFFCLTFLRYKHTIDFFYLDLLYLDQRQFLAILFDLFICSIFFLRYLFYLMVSSDSRPPGIFFLKNMVFVPCFVLIFEVRFSFLKSVESISALKKCPASARILFSLSPFLKVEIYNLFYFIFILSI